MTVRGGGIPRRPLALTPNGRMGPPLRSFAADAHDCIMVRVLGPTGYKVVARLNRAPKAGSPLIVIATALSVPSCSKPSRYGLARAKHAARLVRRPILTASARIDLSDARVGMKKRTLRSNQETDEGKRCAALANSLTKKAPYKGLGAESEEKREPVSDIALELVDSLKVLDPDGRLEKRTISRPSRDVRLVPILLQKSPRREARCALAPNTSLDFEGDYADDRQRDQRDLTLTSHMRRTAEVPVRRAWPTCAGSERLLPA